MSEDGYGEVLTDEWWKRVGRLDHPVDGSRLYRSGDSGDPAFLLLHGIGNSGAVFSPLMPSLAEHGPVIAPTMSPELLAGPTGGPTETMTPLVDWLAAVAPPPWRLVGHSMGGVLTGLILRSHPELVRGAVMLNAPLPGVLDRIRGRDTVDRTGRALLFMKLLSRVTAIGRPRLPGFLRGPELAIVRNALRGFVVAPGELDTRTIARAILRSRTTDGDDFLRLAREMPDWERDPFVERPVRIVLGMDDPLVPLDDVPAVADAYPDGEIVTLERCGHFAHLEQPRRSRDAIVDFFAALD
ncbi:MAG: alpha/beta hydrolase [Actinomycetota bacterium]